MVQELTDDGMAVVWSTAYLDEAERCESVLLLNEGNSSSTARRKSSLIALRSAASA